MVAVRMSTLEIWVGMGVAWVVGLEIIQGRGTLNAIQRRFRFCEVSCGELVLVPEQENEG